MKKKMRMVKASGTGAFPNSTLTIVPVPRKFQDVDGYYAILGVNPRSSELEIKQAAKRKLMETHPDVGGNEDDFCAVMVAYQTLSNPLSKAEYDCKDTAKLDKVMSIKRKVAFEIPDEQNEKPFGYYKNMTDILLDSDMEMLYNWLDAVMNAAHEFRWQADIRVGIGGDRFSDIDGIAVAPRGKNRQDHQVMAKLFVLKQKTKEKL